ncbi:Lycopene beta chloroplastic [Micractinium conductrix]|uniref:lycopene beta-cyclase n=1 Tax=Micractinium conductrix TaxID=554055 RepID=A0A2P6V1J7_9CHLO|nr:Lycopene beta chloroplastic [Micractinium conductrix]|eukprot:PSC67972.1 Lycopene beta chloroplastic [Micractinium conductrix]
MARQQLQQQRQAAAQRLRRCRPAAQSGVSVEAPPSTPVVPRGGRGPASDSSAPLSVSKVLFSDITLPLYDPQEQRTFDLVVVGSGPSGLAVADRVAAAGFQVLIVDPNPRAPWINNFGVWIDEFAAMGLEDCLDYTWDKALVHLDSSAEGARYLSRPYGRVDRPKLKRRLLERCIASGVMFHQAKAQDVKHGGGRSEVQCDGGVGVSGSLVVDATGHSRKLVEFDKAFNPGYQGAYGITVMCAEPHPFDVATMLFMDWRDDHLDAHPDVKERNARLPTFLYAMPFSSTKVFLEETSLVARPIIPFPELKLRLEKRMQHLGIKAVTVEDEEFCAIPMGGCLPVRPQRVIGVGGTAGMVHPSTGYMVSRVIGAAPLIADAIIDQLSAVSDKATDAHLARAPRSEAEADAMAAAVWRAMWPVQRLRQREFFEFGMEVLLKLDLAETREFFAAFFSLSDYHWHGFLSSRLSFLNLIGFGLSLFARSSNAARLNLLQKGLPGLLVMLSRLATLK